MTYHSSLLWADYAEVLTVFAVTVLSFHNTMARNRQSTGAGAILPVFFSYAKQLVEILLNNCFEPRSISSSYNVIIRVREVLKRTVVSD